MGISTPTQNNQPIGDGDLTPIFVKSLLQSLGKLNRPWLTAVEDKLLSLIEREYGIDDRFGFEASGLR
jgi:hypothetical protein